MSQTQKENLVIKISKEMEYLKINLRDTEIIPVNLMAEIFPMGIWHKNWYQLCFTMPMSFPLIDRFMKMMEEQFPEFSLTHDTQHVWSEEKKAGRFLEYTKRNDDYERVVFEVNFRSENEGSTCVLNPISMKMKEVITYEVVCSEEAAQEFGIDV